MRIKSNQILVGDVALEEAVIGCVSQILHFLVLKTKIQDRFAHQMSPIDKLIVALSYIDHVVVIWSHYFDSVE